MCKKCLTTEPDFKHDLCKTCYWKPENRSVRDEARQGKSEYQFADPKFIGEFSIDGGHAWQSHPISPPAVDDSIDLGWSVETNRPLDASDVKDPVDAGKLAVFQVWLPAATPFDCDSCGAVKPFGEVHRLPGYHPIQAGTLYAAVCDCRARGSLAVWRHSSVASALPSFSAEDQRAFYKRRAKGLAEAEAMVAFDVFRKEVPRAYPMFVASMKAAGVRLQGPARTPADFRNLVRALAYGAMPEAIPARVVWLTELQALDPALWFFVRNDPVVTECLRATRPAPKLEASASCVDEPNPFRKWTDREGEERLARAILGPAYVAKTEAELAYQAVLDGFRGMSATEATARLQELQARDPASHARASRDPVVLECFRT